MKTTINLLGFWVCLIFCGCNPELLDLNNSGLPDLSGEYHYTGYNLNGDTVSTGILTIKFDSTTISGTKDLFGTGYENGNGPIIGELDNFDNITIDLSPDSLYKILIKGRFQQTIDGLITGERYGDSGTGVSLIKKGTFRAERK